MTLRAVVPRVAGPVIGIDLGTTNSLAAVLDHGRPRVLENALGERLTPSAVSVADDGSMLVGAAARARAVTHPERTAVSFKRDMGTPQRYDLAGRSLGAIELSALVLGAVRADAQAALGTRVLDAVVSVPAYFGEAQRQATRQAAELAGLRVLRIVNEPTAAALAYGLDARDRELKAAVLDLGGGTFDVTLLQITEGVIEVLSTAGDARLGGDDFTEALAELARADALGAHRGDLRSSRPVWARVLAACERAKRALSLRDEAEIQVIDLADEQGPRHVEMRLTRARAEAAWAPLREALRRPILRALSDAGFDRGEIDEVLLVGGATRMPCVRLLAQEVLGRQPLTRLPPDEAIALGAAVFAGLASADRSVGDLVVTDVAPFSLGLATAEEWAGGVATGIFAPILDRGTVLPATRSKRFFTMADGQSEILIEVFQGEHALCAQNERLGAYRVAGLTAAPAGRQAVEVRFSFDLGGLLEVETTVLSDGRKEVLVIEQSPGRLSPAEMEAARQRIARLKIHPKELLPNATALARAEGRYVEVVGVPRDRLGGRLAAFRAALESQETAAIDVTRAALNALVAELDQD